MPSSDVVHLSECFQGNTDKLLKFAEEQDLEGLVAKHLKSIYESDRATGAWSKYRINQGQEFVIGGFTPGSLGFDAILVGFYRDSHLIFCASVRGGFVPSARRKLFARLNLFSLSSAHFPTCLKNRQDIESLRTG